MKILAFAHSVLSVDGCACVEQTLNALEVTAGGGAVQRCLFLLQDTNKN